MSTVPQPASGLCATCRWRRLVPGARTTFVLCERGTRDPRFPKYPPLPVRHCAGFEPAPTTSDDPGTEGPG